MEKNVVGRINSIPLELELNILSRLSVKQLYRLRLVSKHWHDLISSQYFVKLQRQHHAIGNSEGTVIFVDWFSGSTFSYDFHADILTKLTPIENHNSLVGCCNGLLCFRLSRGFTLQNPVTGAYKVITRFHEPYLRCNGFSVSPGGEGYLAIHELGFGYDCFSDDYKVLSIHKVCLFNRKSWKTETFEEEGADIYSFKANSWKVLNNELLYRRMHSSKYEFRSNSGTMFMTNNALNWLTDYPQEEYQRCAILISSFDLRTEEYREMQPPDGISTPAKGSTVYMSALQSCLHILHSTRDLSRMEIWVMKEYGVEQSWTKVFHCSLIHQLEYLYGSCCRGLLPCAYSKDGQEIFIAIPCTEQSLVRCNLQRHQVSIVELPTVPGHGYRTMPWTGFLDSPIDN